MAKKLSFEKSLETLERLVEELESGELTLDAALERYERGVAAHKECMQILAAAEKRIEVLLQNEAGEFETRPTGPPEDAGEEADEDDA